MSKPELIIVGGANGSGKTTSRAKVRCIARLPLSGAMRLPLEIYAGHPNLAAVSARKEFVRRFARAIKKRSRLSSSPTLRTQFTAS